MIKLYFETLDGVRKTKSFNTLAGARKTTWNWVGKDAEIGSYYAVSGDGVVKVTILQGCTLAELFSDGSPKAPQPKGMHFKIKVDGQYIAETFKYQHDVDRFMNENGDITYDKPDGSIGVCQIVPELWTDEGGELRQLHPAPKVQPIDGNDDIPF